MAVTELAFVAVRIAAYGGAMTQETAPLGELQVIAQLPAAL